MKSAIRRIGVVSMLSLSSFAFTSVVQPAPAQAVIAAAAWPLFPLIIVGASLEGAAVLTSGASMRASALGYHRASLDAAGVALSEFFTGIVFLDASSEGGTIQPIAPEQAPQYGLTEAERRAYNKAVAEGLMEEIFDTATQRLHAIGVSAEQAVDLAMATMKDLLSNLDSEAHSAFTKISRYLIQSRQW